MLNYARKLDFMIPAINEGKSNYLDLSKIQIEDYETEVIARIGDKTKVERIYFGMCELTTKPFSFEGFTNLKEINLNNNHLKNIDFLFEYPLENLEYLTVDNNKLTSIPESIQLFKNLRVLSLISNRICKLPQSIGNLKNLEELWLNDNLLPSLPSTTSGLKKLKLLLLYQNHLTTIPCRYPKN